MNVAQRPFSRLFFLFAFVFFSWAKAGNAAESFRLSHLWSIAPETRGFEWVGTNHTHRGLAFNPVTSHVLTVARHPGTRGGVYILDNETGRLLGGLNTNGVFVGIQFPLNAIGVADDGAIYACNLTIDSSELELGSTGPFRIYRWEDEKAQPTLAYLGDPCNGDTNKNHRRFGDSFAVRGAGDNTEIIIGTRAGRVAARFTTLDGVSFNHQKIQVPDLLGVSAMATIGFGASNTFWVKAEAGPQTEYPVQYFRYDPVTATADLIENYTAPLLHGGPLGFDASRNLLAVVSGTRHEVRLFKYTSKGFVHQGAPVPFRTANQNSNLAGAVVFAGDRVFALDTNNGILAMRLSTVQ